MSLYRILIATLVLTFLACAPAFAAEEAATENSVPAPEVAAPAEAAAMPLVLPPVSAEAAPHHEAAATGGHAAKAEGGHQPAAGGHKKAEHWTVFNLIPMEWTKDVAVIVGGWFGVTESQLNPALYDSHGLLHVMILFFVFILLTVISVSMGGKYNKMLESGDIAPAPGISVGNFVEAVVKTVLGMMEETIGHGASKYLPLIGTAALVILFSNLLGLIPGFYTSNDNLNSTLPMALVMFLMYHYYGMKTHGVGKYLAHFMGPLEGKLKYIMAPIMIPIELISHFARPISLSLRLFGNMFGDHKVFAVFMGMTALPLFYPVPFLALGLLVAIVQTLVFCLLSMVYISLATAKDH